jgi:DNA polymerase/3'-5' exonuclease PolX
VETSPPNFGVLLLARTGSAMHNVYIAQRADELGLHFNPHRGIQRGRLKTSRVIASEEERDIFAALKLEFIPPEKRER